MNKAFKLIWKSLCLFMPQTAAKIQYKHIMRQSIDFSNPRDINEKINFLKFNSDLEEWARLSDKYAVRDYLKERGLNDILVPLYGKYDNAKELLNDWDNFPQSFIIKANHGCGTIKLVRDKEKVNKIHLEKEMSAWLKDKYGLETNERHYLKIKPCLIVEALLEDNSVKDFSRSLIDYKIWCFDGKPYCILVCVDRNIDNTDAEHYVHLDTYDLQWNRIENSMSDIVSLPSQKIPKPQNLERMLKCASLLSQNHKQVRVDLYNIDGKIYFGEMTFTSQSGYMNYFSREFLLELGDQINLK